MKLKHLLCASLLAVAAAGPALADDLNQNVPLVANAGLPGAYSGAWGVTHLEAGAFTDTFNFADGISGRLAGVFSTIGFLDSTNIDFTSVMVNGDAFNLSSAGGVDLATLLPTDLSSPIIITVMGIAAPALTDGTAIAASYSGSVNISPVPEPQSYALMLAGLGALGFVARRRNRS